MGILAAVNHGKWLLDRTLMSATCFCPLSFPVALVLQIILRLRLSGSVVMLKRHPCNVLPVIALASR